MINKRLKEEELSKELKIVREESIQEAREAREEFIREAEVFRKEMSGKTKHLANKQAIAQVLAIVIPIFLITTTFGIYTLWNVGTEVNFLTVLTVMRVSAPASLCFAVLVTLIIIKNRRQVLEISIALEQAMSGNLDYRLDWYQKGVMGQAYIDFNRMCQQLKATRKEMYKAIDEANRANNAKSSFLSNMSHEIRTPINAVLGMDEMIIRESREENIRDYAMDIKSAGRTLLSLINDILDFSKIESGKMEIIPVEYDLSSVINDLLNMTEKKAKDKGLELEINVDETMPHILYGDEVRIKQAALNVLNNAVKYTDTGKVTLSLGYERADDKHINLTIRVVDTGKGIKEEDLSKLFSPFERIEEKRNRSIEGTGLGMSITKNLLAMMNSELKVSSVYGEGSDFSFTILQHIVSEEPIGDFVESYKKLKAKQSHYRESFHAPNARLLIIDDVEMNLTVATSLLKRTQIQIDTGSSGRQALEKATQVHYDIIFIDHMMPDMDGIETLAHLRAECELNKETPVIVLTANAVSGAREKYMEAGFDNYLTKPIDSEKLEKTICDYLPEDLIETDFEEEETQDLPDSFEEKLTSLSEENQGIITALMTLEFIDVKAGANAAGGIETYLNVVKDFYNTGEGRLGQISSFYEAGDYRNYTIQVHALKSSARLLGDLSLSEKAEYLEAMGNEENEGEITNRTPGLLTDYRNVLNDLAAVLENDSDKPVIPDKLLNEAICSIIEVVEAYDFDTADMIMDQLKDYSMPEDFKPIFGQLKGLMSEVERDGILNLLKENSRG